MHIKAYTESPSQYPERFALKADEIEWDQKCECYAPVYYTSNVVLNEFAKNGDSGWADPEDISQVHRKITSFITQLNFDDFNRPINPMGRTGIIGRGLLGKWGPNFAGDPIVTRLNSLTKKIELLVIQRKDCLQWALPGGMVDVNESPLEATSRELKEEAGVDLAFEAKDIVYQGYVDDRRNTDNSWMETTAAHKHLNYEESTALKLSANDDAKDVKWQEINSDLLNNLYASHREFVELAIQKINDISLDCKA